MDRYEQIRHFGLPKATHEYACTQEAQEHPTTLLLLQNIVDRFGQQAEDLDQVAKEVDALWTLVVATDKAIEKVRSAHHG